MNTFESLEAEIEQIGFRIRMLKSIDKTIDSMVYQGFRRCKIKNIDVTEDSHLLIFCKAMDKIILEIRELDDLRRKLNRRFTGLLYEKHNTKWEDE